MKIEITLTPSEITFIKSFREDPDTFNPTDDIENLWEIIESLSDAVEYEEKYGKQ